MLVKCVCSSCAHSFLTDDQAGDLTCPRCGHLNEGATVGGFSAPPPHAHAHAMAEPDRRHGPPDPAFAEPAYFDPKTPPPIFMSWDKMVRGMVFGTLLCAAIAAAVGAGLAATGMILPGVAAVIVGLTAGAATRHGMGGRTARRTMHYAILAILVVVTAGFTGLFAGGWLVERFTGTRAPVARKDIEVGKKTLQKGLARAQAADDVAERSLLETRMRRVERLQALSDPQLEDYLWIQQAQINQPLVAYGKIRVMAGPMLKLGPDRAPYEAPDKRLPPVIAGGELLLALILAFLGVRPKR